MGSASGGGSVGTVSNQRWDNTAAAAADSFTDFSADRYEIVDLEGKLATDTFTNTFDGVAMENVKMEDFFNTGDFVENDDDFTEAEKDWIKQARYDPERLDTIETQVDVCAGSS